MGASFGFLFVSLITTTFCPILTCQDFQFCFPVPAAFTPPNMISLFVCLFVSLGLFLLKDLLFLCLVPSLFIVSFFGWSPVTENPPKIGGLTKIHFLLLPSHIQLKSSSLCFGLVFGLCFDLVLGLCFGLELGLGLVWYLICVHVLLPLIVSCFNVLP